MNRQSQIIIVTLFAIIVGLGITVGVMAAGDDDHDGPMSGHMDGDDAYLGMMGAMGSMNADDMLEHMQEVLGEEGYQRMLEHFADHRDGGSMNDNPAVDEMMHSMMDGMMQHMPADGNDVLPPSNDEHHETPSP
jgi:hypothetical protein